MTYYFRRCFHYKEKENDFHSSRQCFRHSHYLLKEKEEEVQIKQYYLRFSIFSHESDNASNQNDVITRLIQCDNKLVRLNQVSSCSGVIQHR